MGRSISNIGTLSSKGQLVIPTEIRKKLKWKKGTILYLIVKGDMITLKKIATEMTEEEKEELEDIIEAWRDVEKGEYNKYTNDQLMAKMDKMIADLDEKKELSD